MRRGQPIPVTIIGGFLGAGKTTLLNRLLEGAAGQRLGLIVNDFGDINIDEKLIVARDEEMVSLANGCICCSIGNDFLRALVALVSRADPPDQIVIEASGVANPARIAAIAQADRDLLLYGVIVLVDAVNFRRQYDDPLLADTMEGQLTNCDLLILTKTDIADEGEVAKVGQLVCQIAPTARVIASALDGLPLGLMLNHHVGAVALDAGDVHVHHSFWTGSVVRERPCDMTKLRLVLDDLPFSVLRVKGVVRDGEGVRHIVQWVAGRLTLSPDASSLPESDEGALVYIGAGEADEEEGVRALLSSAFAIGD